MWNLLSVYLEIVLVLVQDRSMVCAKCTLGSKINLDTPILLGDKAQVEARFGLSDIVLILMHDRCTVYVERTIGSEIIFDAPDGTPR